MSLTGKVALITGGSKGIGKACVERLARDGASVVINYNRDADSANALVSSIGADRALAVQAYVSSLVDVDRLIDEAVKQFGHVDLIMANTGMMLMRNVENTSEEDFDQCFNLNVKSPYFMAQVSHENYHNATNLVNHQILTSDLENRSAHAPWRSSHLCLDRHLPLFHGAAGLSIVCPYKRRG